MSEVLNSAAKPRSRMETYQDAVEGNDILSIWRLRSLLRRRNWFFLKTLPSGRRKRLAGCCLDQ
ncbi:Hypothetical protein FKW44_021011 [Caligus rogercresseyi]|uniref:Uncharacterized protein n=1 Tax=Caligus rogercresseyi TaxID=217165 RepID=A0A7T8GQS6_CALRO|nr:Hypothetical protein FKW44_021011 [Caligus rogercresseyi]